MTEIPEHLVTQCRSCGARIVFAASHTGKSLPVDAQPAVGGTVRLRVDQAGAVHAQVVAAKLAFGQSDLHRSHFSTCPHAGAHRRRATS